MDLKLVNEDSRRTLYEFGEGGNWKVAKCLYIQEDCIIGDHFHKEKDELFLLVKGRGFYNGSIMLSPSSVFVPRGTYHKFELEEYSILICLASELHNPKDDYKKEI